MPYNITLSNGDVLIAGGLLDNTADSANTSLVLVGKNYKGYGLFLNQNFVRLMENFAKTTAPTAPLPGQIWFNSTTKRLNVNISSTKGTLDANWKGIAGLTLSASTPSTQYTGELWYDTTNGQLKIYTGTEWRLVGPLSRLATGNTGAIPDTVTDAPPLFTYVILKFFLNNVLVGIWSKEEDFASDVPGFATIRKGLNFNSTLDHKFWGTASVADNIFVGGTPTPGSAFLRNDQSGTTTGALSILNDTGLNVGAASDFNANVTGGTVNLRNVTNNRDLVLSLRRSGLQTPFLRGNNQTGLAEVYAHPVGSSPALTVATKNYVDRVTGAVTGVANFFGEVTPDANVTYTLGNTTNRWSTIFSESILVGNVNAANTFATISNVAQIYLGADITPSANINSNLGSSARRFDTLHSNSAALTGQLTVGLSTSIGGNLSVSSNLLITGNTAVGSNLTVAANTNVGGNITIASLTESRTVSTGALVVSGGLGVAGNVNVGNEIRTPTMPAGTANTAVATTQFVAVNSVPTGAIHMFANVTTAPTGWLFCNGAAVSRATFSALFSVLGTTYGSGDGSTTFNIPDFRDRVGIGSGSTYGIGSSGKLDEEVPVGSLTMWTASGAIPDGWLLCDGSTQSRTGQYSPLFAVIGTTYENAGDSGSVFRLPDYRGMFLRGLDEGRGVDPQRTLRATYQKGSLIWKDSGSSPGSAPGDVGIYALTSGNINASTGKNSGLDSYGAVRSLYQPSYVQTEFPGYTSLNTPVLTSTIIGGSSDATNYLTPTGIGNVQWPDGYWNHDLLFGITRPHNQAVRYIIKARNQETNAAVGYLVAPYIIKT
jgi:microcystin-dependent protein